MKMRHKRVMKRIVAGIFALLMAYVASFGSWIVFPFAVGFGFVQYLSWRFANTPSDVITSRPLAFDYSVIVIIVMSAIAVFLSNAITAALIFTFGIAGVLLSYMLTKVEINVKKKKKR